MFRYADVVCLCLVCILHDLQFVNAGVIYQTFFSRTATTCFLIIHVNTLLIQEVKQNLQ